MTPSVDDLPLLADELDWLTQYVRLSGVHLIELGCGAARTAKRVLAQYPDTQLTGLEVDAVQMAKNLADPHPRLHFIDAGAQAIPCPSATFDGAMMLKSLHHVPMSLMDQALAEVARVVRPGGWLYVSEPIYDGALNEVVRLYNDEGTVRAAAQAAVDRALAAQRDWTVWADHRFAQAVQFADFADFEKRMMQPSFIDLRISDDLRQQVRTAFEPHQGPNGAAFVRPMLVRLLRRLPV